MSSCTRILKTKLLFRCRNLIFSRFKNCENGFWFWLQLKNISLALSKNSTPPPKNSTAPPKNPTSSSPPKNVLFKTRCILATYQAGPDQTTDRRASPYRPKLNFRWNWILGEIEFGENRIQGKSNLAEIEISGNWNFKLGEMEFSGNRNWN